MGSTGLAAAVPYPGKATPAEDYIKCRHVYIYKMPHPIRFAFDLFVTGSCIGYVKQMTFGCHL